ncbi:MAG: bifunctional DNA primase/polymerase [Planctomycetota bacterium]|nr:bifunctional DNA primase/polymerase [Planctomycetota bacterium]
MTTNRKSSSHSQPGPSRTTLDAARAYTDRGWRVLPIPHRSKNPGVVDWPNLRLDIEDLPPHFITEPLNIGVLLGEPSDGLIDIDLDHNLAVELADEYLPPTPCEFGRAGKPRSHRLYRVTTPLKTRKRRSPGHGTIVEIRSTGCQTVFPPSTHPSGEAIEWVDSDVEPTEVDAGFLIDAVERLFDAVHRELVGGQQPPALALCEDEEVGKDADGARAGKLDQSLLDCLASMKKMKIQDQQDGSHRLFAAACRTVEHDLDETQAIACIRTYASHVPFPRTWTDDEILQRVHDAEQKCTRGDVFNRDDEPSSSKESQATILVGLCDDIELFHDDDRAYATLQIGDRIETLLLRSRAFKRWLSRQFYKTIGKAPNSQSLSDAIGVLEGKGLFDGPEHRVHVRLAEHEGAIYLDLADEHGHIVCVTLHGWDLLTETPVRFRRPRGMQTLPMPSREGEVGELRQFINLERNEDFMLLVAWLVAALRPGLPVPVLAFSSEQGSGKSTASRLLRGLIDPNEAPIRCEPREVRDLMIAAGNGLVVAYDNLSRIQPWLSDSLCRLSTGGGFSTRVLYENDEEQIFDALRPVLLNGIEELGERSDLLDRTIRLSLPSIPEEERQPEQVIFAQFERARPRILGGLLTAVSAALSRIDAVNLDRLPRMADFARWIVAAESALPWPEGGFMQAYTDNRAGAHELALEASPISEPLRKFAEIKVNWTGTATDLLRELEEHADEQTRKQRGWPKYPNTLGNQLRRVAPNLRAVGVSIEFPERTHQGRTLIIKKVSQSVDTVDTVCRTTHFENKNNDCRDRNMTTRDDGVTIEDRAQILAVTQRDNHDNELQTPSDIVWDGDLEEHAAILEIDGELTRNQAVAHALACRRNELNGQRNGVLT